MNSTLLHQLRNINTIPLQVWQPSEPFLSVTENHELLSYPFTVPMTSNYSIDIFWCETNSRIVILEWDYLYTLSICHDTVCAKNGAFGFWSRFKESCMYFVLAYAPAHLVFPITIKPFTLEESFESEILPEQVLSLLNGLVRTEEKSHCYIYPDFKDTLDLSRWVRENPRIKIRFGLSFEEKQRCKPKKYIAYKRVNYLKTLLNQICCHTPFELEQEFLLDKKPQLIASLDCYNPGWKATDRDFPLYVRRFFQQENMRNFKFYPHVYHVCREMGGYQLTLTIDQYRDVLLAFKLMERKWTEKPHRHNFPYFPLIIHTLAKQVGAKWGYDLVSLKDLKKQIILEQWLEKMDTREAHSNFKLISLATSKKNILSKRFE